MSDIKTDTFIDYIKTRHLSRDTFIEDFVAEALMLIYDGTFPKVRTWDELHIYLQARNASAVVNEGASRCWRNFAKLRQLRSRTSSGVSRKLLEDRGVATRSKSAAAGSSSSATTRMK
jgi:hypothetical protein